VLGNNKSKEVSKEVVVEKVKNTIKNINDVEELKKMLKSSNSRGKKQRIKKKLDILTGVAPTSETVSSKNKV
jgi:S-adenosylmethionine/arginine decarboxylase-like enzyme